MVESVTLKKLGYRVSGMAKCEMWGGGVGFIQMESFDVKDYSNKTLLKNINDGGFGVVSVNGAICEVFELFENNYTEHIVDVSVGNMTEKEEEEMFELIYQ